MYSLCSEKNGINQGSLLPPGNEVWGKVMFSQASVIPSARKGWLPSIHHRSHDQGGLHPGGGGMPPGGSASRGSASRGVGQTLPTRDTWDTTGYGQQVGGTHPTGMHSCSKI